jgi:plastocyanin
MIRLTASSFVVAVIAAALFLVPALATSQKTIAIKGEVGPGFKIEVEKGDNDLKKTKAGMYRIHVEDKSSIHNFHLIGPGVNKKTSVSFKGETNWTIRLKPGRYTYQCDPHAASGMKGHFTVTK